MVLRRKYLCQLITLTLTKRTMIDIQSLIDRHETFKIKGLQLSNDDLFNRLSLQDEMVTVVSNLKAEYLEKKLKLDKDKALRGMELKMQKDDNGKTSNTDKFIEQLLKKEFYDQDLELLVLKNSYELLYGKAQTITDLVNVVKLNKKADFTL